MIDASTLPEQLREAENRMRGGGYVAPDIVAEAVSRIEALKKFVQLVADQCPDAALKHSARRLGAF